MTVERNLLILPARKSGLNPWFNPTLSNGRPAIEKFIAKLSLPGYRKVEGKERIAVVNAVHAKIREEEGGNTVGSHIVLRNPNVHEKENTGFYSNFIGGESTVRMSIGSYLENPQNVEADKEHLRVDLRELWTWMMLESLHVFASAAALDFAKHGLLNGYRAVQTKTLGKKNEFFDSVAYADARGNRVYVFNLELSPLETTSRKDSGLLVVSNVFLGAKEAVEAAAKALQEIFQGIVGIWTSNQQK